MGLLVIDMQRFFLEGGSHAVVLRPDDVVRCANELIDAFRRAGRPVMFTRHGYAAGDDIGAMGRWWRDNLMLDQPRSEIDPRLGMEPRDQVFIKTRYNAFRKTKLREFLAMEEVTQLVLCGVMTHLCVESTAREAFDQDLDVFVVSDAVSTNSEAFQTAALGIMDHGFARVMGLAAVLEVLR